MNNKRKNNNNKNSENFGDIENIEENYVIIE